MIRPFLANLPGEKAYSIK
uniref:Uncharacterized protein n=1 Tax=Saccharomyces cerevisiae TaxID=4932 RepID=A2MYT8_YEASX|nr:unknown protein [Saccharomyces cerevisiae]